MCIKPFFRLPIKLKLRYGPPITMNLRSFGNFRVHGKEHVFIYGRVSHISLVANVNKLAMLTVLGLG